MSRETRCSALIFDPSFKSILLLNQIDRQGTTYWWFPGGGLEENETEIECIQRELIEELNIVPEIIKQFVIDDQITGTLYKRYVNFICTLSKDVEIPPNPDEHHPIIGYKWFSIVNSKCYEPQLLDDLVYPFLIEAKRLIVSVR